VKNKENIEVDGLQLKVCAFFFHQSDGITSQSQQRHTVSGYDYNLAGVCLAEIGGHAIIQEAQQLVSCDCDGHS